MQITHPHHPLSGQTVKVLRHARRPGSAEPCWLIETSTGARQLVAQAWCEPAPDSLTPAPSPRPLLAPVDVTILRRLVIMVRQLSASQEPHHDPTTAPCPAAAPARPTADPAHPGLVGTAPGTPAAGPAHPGPDAPAQPAPGGQP